jgi:hypothetical protein
LLAIRQRSFYLEERKYGSYLPISKLITSVNQNVHPLTLHVLSLSVLRAKNKRTIPQGITDDLMCTVGFRFESGNRTFYTVSTHDQFYIHTQHEEFG